MALKIKDIVRKEKTVTLDLGDGDELELTYNPYKFNKEFYESLTAVEDDKLYHVVADNIKGWNITDDDGEAMPVSFEFVKTLPLALLQQMWVGVLKDAQSFDPKLISAA